MHALVCIDHTFFYDEEEDVFSEGQFPYSLWKKYFDFFDELTIVQPLQGRRCILLQTQGALTLFATLGYVV